MKLIQKHSNINRQIAGLVTIVILATLAFCCIVNACFFGDFYLFQKELDMRKMYKDVSMQSANDNLYTDDGYKITSNLADKYSVSVLISNASGDCLLCYGGQEDDLFNKMRYILFDKTSSANVILSDDSFVIQTISFENFDSDYLALIGTLPDENVIFLSCPSSNFKYISGVSSRFLIVVFLIAAIVTMLIVINIVSRMTKPLFNLIDITKRISNFDFSTKYRPQKFYNELDDLGEHINEMSSTLERSISQLKKANEKLKKDLEIQEEAENMRKDFISNVSHELKTPIALIQGYAEGLQEGIMDDENSRKIYLDVILDEANKMNRLVREMLILNQLEAGQMDAELCDFNLTDILDGIIESNKIYFEAQAINFSFVNKDVCMVHADEFLVEQVFSNFMSNAIHYVMNENIIMVKYEFVKRNRVRISVFNSGGNIPKKDIKHIWDKFYKVDKARSREYGGSGIGLSVVKATMELLHEKFGVENLSNGVEFWFELSLSKNTKIKQNT